jgi:hypothetical protein
LTLLAAMTAPRSGKVMDAKILDLQILGASLTRVNHWAFTCRSRGLAISSRPMVIRKKPVKMTISIMMGGSHHQYHAAQQGRGAGRIVDNHAKRRHAGGAEAQHLQAGGAQDGAGNAAGEAGCQPRQHVGQHLHKHDFESTGAGEHRHTHVAALAQGQHLGPDEPRRAGPGKHRQDQGHRGGVGHLDVGGDDDQNHQRGIVITESLMCE